ncbi:MAG TPA: hypothetical protein VFO69_10035 [Allosphingosinicella sp.]|nr:hypothetical protein [Allosphingosinicella sp.]
MRKILTSAMVAGAALMVAACGGETEVNNTAATDLGNDMSMDANMTDMGMDANMTDMNMTDTNMTLDTDTNTTTTTTTTETNTTTTNGM